MKTLPALAAVCGIILGTTTYFASRTITYFASHTHPQKPVPIRAVVIALDDTPRAAVIIASDGTEITVPFMGCFTDATCKAILLGIEKAGNEDTLDIHTTAPAGTGT